MIVHPSSSEPDAQPEPSTRQTARVTEGRKRASKACSRCRRYRTKCVPLRRDDPLSTPCGPCMNLGLGDECTFLPRGQSSLDRNHRRRAVTNAASTTSPSHLPPTPPVLDLPVHTRDSTSPTHRHQRDPLSPNRPPLPSSSISYHNSNMQNNLPPPAEVVEAIRNYVSSYFQLGFLHKALFVERYTSHPESISELLLLAICSIAAPFTPSLVSRYGGKKKATDFFLSRADAMLGVEMIRPSLERTQAFLLLGVTEWGQGNGPKAWMLIGTAVRMAGFLGLHRESTYQLPVNPPAEAVIESEVARRTFWAVTCHENLLAGQARPMQISLQEIDVLLPCEETEFNFGIQPIHRPSIAGILGNSPVDPIVERSKSLFASLVQVKILWSFTARHACKGTGRLEDVPWSAASQSILTALQDFEDRLPIKHRFSVTNLRGMMVEGLDLAFLSITLITRLSNIVIRRLYLPSMAVVIDADGPTEINFESRRFWQQMADDMISNSEQLLSQVETFFGMRSVELGFPPIMVFGVYMCGNVFSYLCKWPELCLSRASAAERSYRRCVEILEQLADSWPLAAQWHAALQSSRSELNRQIQNQSQAATQGGETRIRAAVRGERTLDDEMAGIYGQSARSIVNSSTSPEDRSRLSERTTFSNPLASLHSGVQVNRPLDTSTSVIQATSVYDPQQVNTEVERQDQTTNHLHMPVAQGSDQSTALPTIPMSFPTQSIGSQPQSQYDLLPDTEGMLTVNGGLDFFLDTDTFGEDLSAFLQSGVPVGAGEGESDGNADDLFSHAWDR